MKKLFSYRKLTLSLSLSLSLLCVIIQMNAFAQITFQKTYYRDSFYYSSDQSYYNFGNQRIHAIDQDKSGTDDYYFVGSYGEFRDNRDPNYPIQSVWRNGNVVKTNKKGEIQWAKSLFNQVGFSDVTCVYDDNGDFDGLIVAGNAHHHSNTNIDYRGFHLLRMDASGNLAHYKDYMGNLYIGASFKVEQTTDINGNVDGFIATGFVWDTKDKIYLVKTDDALNLTWSKIFSIPNIDARAYSVKQTADKGYILTGKAGTNLCVIKTDASGNISWQKLYTLGSSFTGKDIIEVINASSNSEYFIAAENSLDMVILHIDQAGTILGNKILDLPGTVETAQGITYLSSGHITISGTSADKPVLVKIDAALNTVVFGQKYTSTQQVTAVTTTTDNGYIIGGLGYANWPYALIKTDGSGFSDCNEVSINPVPNAPLSVTANASFASATGFSPVDRPGNPSNIPLKEIVHCRDFCKGISYSTIQTNIHACYNDALSLTANCPPGTAITQWFLAPNLNTAIASGSSFSPSTTNNGGIYIVRCMNEDSCILYEEEFTLTVSPAPDGTYELIEACYGQYIELTTPCPNGYAWVNPSGHPNPTYNTTALGNAAYTVDCYDMFGCVIRTHYFDVQVVSYPVVLQQPTVTICEGSSYDLNNSIPGCTWSELPNHTPVSGSVVAPTNNTSYHAECRDANGCYSYHIVPIEVTPAPVTSYAISVCEGNSIYLDQHLSGGVNCTWINMGNGQQVPGSGFTMPVGSYLYRATCTDANGCLSYYEVYVDVIPWQVIPVTVHAPCGVPFAFTDFSDLCESGVTSWAALVGTDYVMFPLGWAPTQNIIAYGFGVNTYGQCCRVELNIIVDEATPTYHELCFGGLSYTIPFNCAPGATTEWYKNGMPQPTGFVNSAGTYEVKCRDANGCVVRHAIFNIHFEEYCTPQILCLNENPISQFCVGGATHITCGKNGSPYPVSGFNVYPNGAGTYIVTCWDALGNNLGTYYYYVHYCNGSADKSAGNTGVEEKLLASGIEVFPNPNTGIFNLRVPATVQQLKLRIYDILGKTIIDKQLQPAGNDIVLDLSPYAKGVYHLQVIADGIQHTRKVVVR